MGGDSIPAFIRRYHVANGDSGRDVILIPSSAHGTNAASTTLANLRVVVVATADDGSIDLADLDAVLNGDMQDLITALQAQERAERLEADGQWPAHRSCPRARH